MAGGLGGVHNAFIQILAEQGILGFTAFAALWLWAGRSIMLAMRHETTRGFAILLAGIITGQFVYLLIDPVNREIWLTLAVAAALGPIASRRPNAAGVRTSDQAAHPPA
jgi:O-antigen ligase